MESSNDTSVKLSGSVTARLYGPDGKLKQQVETHNIIVTVGKTYMANFIATPNASTFMAYQAIGTGTPVPAIGDTALVYEGETNRATATLSASGSVWTSLATFIVNNPGSALAVNEYGIFSATSGATMFAHATAATINKGTADTLAVTWNVALGV